jgi:transcriptional regulator with XRE-family HTH domain
MGDSLWSNLWKSVEFGWKEGVAMSTATGTTRFGVVNDDSGDRVKLGMSVEARRVKLGMSVKALAETAGVDRSRVVAIEAGEPTVRAATLGAVMAALDRLEDEMGMRDADHPSTRAIGDPSEDLVEFTIEGNFGVRAVVKGPVRDLEALQGAVSKLVRDMQSQTPEDPEEP